MSKTYFITGISTEVGKTVASAIVTQALHADYWKPIQAGDLDNTDTHKVKKWVTNSKTVFHESAYNLNTPMSPHAAAAIDGVNVSVKNIKRPRTNNKLVIEGAGGLLVPINQKETIADLIEPKDNVIVISRHYLGSINHTLLTIEALKQRNLNITGIIFSGEEHPSTEAIIASKTKIPILCRIDEEPYINEHVISEYAEILKEKL